MMGMDSSSKRSPIPRYSTHGGTPGGKEKNATHPPTHPLSTHPPTHPPTHPQEEEEEEEEGGRAPKTISLAELRLYFDKPIEDAAKAIGICSTLLKKICRKYHIKRWPYR